MIYGDRDGPNALISKEAFGRKASFSAAPPSSHTLGLKTQEPKVEVPRFVVFCLDWSASMMSQDTGKRGETRFGACVDRVQHILREQVRENDIVSVVGFGANLQTSLPPTRRGRDLHRLESLIGSLQPSAAGGTCFFDAVAHSLQMMKSGENVPLDSPRWLICLTDGDDIGSRKENENGEVVARLLDSGIDKLNMIMITVGKLKANNLRTIGSWTDRVARNGGHGQLLSEKDAVSIGKAFEVVAEALASDVGGAIEC
jgi:hypothetical protein